jgi:hypothetical protein
LVSGIGFHKAFGQLDGFWFSPGYKIKQTFGESDRLHSWALDLLVLGQTAGFSGFGSNNSVKTV